MSAEDRLKELGLTLPDVPTPVATYVSFKQVGDMVYLSGQGPKRADGTYPTGKVGAEVSDDARFVVERRDGFVTVRVSVRSRSPLPGLSWPLSARSIAVDET